MPSLLQLSWENFRSTILVAGEQRVHRISSNPIIEVFADGARDRVGIWLSTAHTSDLTDVVSKLVSISARFIEREGHMFLEVSTASASLQRQFYHFAVAVAERVAAEGVSPVEAVHQELRCFGELLEETPLLGPERQLGLLGELLFLERLIAAHGAGALDSWLGPLGEPHDFRFGQVEFEVKTTVAPHRIHTINGEEQLVAFAGCSLYLVSVMLGPPGAQPGFSLSSKAEQLAASFGLSIPRVNRFLGGLEAAGFRSSDSVYYQRSFALRRPIALVPVNATFPAITRPVIQQALGSSATRVESLRYDVDLEGLEVEDGSSAFVSVIPRHV